MLLCRLVHFGLNRIEQRCCLRLHLVQRHVNFLSRVAAHKDALVILDIFGSDFNAERYAAHLALAELPARALVRSVHLHAQAFFYQTVTKRVCLVEHTLLLLLDWNDHNLGRRHLWRKFETGIVSVYHNDRADETRRHPP